MTKKWYHSKTLWVNAIAAVAIIVQAATGYKLSAEIQGAILVVLNIVLRAITSSGLEK